MSISLKGAGKANRVIKSIEYYLADGSAHGVRVLFKASGAINWLSMRDDQRKYSPVLNLKDLRQLFALHCVRYRTVLLTTGEIVEYVPSLKGHTIISGEELGFSWRKCDNCDSPLDGDRFAGQHYDTATGEKQSLQVCVDCMEDYCC